MRLFSDFNQNIKTELKQTETSKPKDINKAKEKSESTYKEYREYAKAQGVLTRRINKYEKTDPSLAESFRDTREDFIKLKDASKAIYETQKSAYNKLAGFDYDIKVNVHVFKNSGKPEYQKPLTIKKSRLLKMANPAAFILKEQKKRLAYELGESKKELESLKLKLLVDITPEELKKIRQLQGAQKGLTTLLKKAESSLKSSLASQSANQEEEEEEEEEGEPDNTSGKETSADVPFFYTPLEGFIDIF